MHICLSIKTFSDIIFIVYYIIAIIMEFYQPFTIEVYLTFQDLYIAINLHILKEDYTIIMK